MSAVAAVTCRKPGCQAVTTKNCAEGHAPLESCPWYGTALEHPETNIRDVPVDGVASPEDDFVELLSGAPLPPQTLDAFVRARPVRLVAIVGDRDSGKTTLVCAIYEHFLKAQFSEWLFCGSRTLIGFEERSHDCRTASGRAIPDTAHTSLAEGLQFFHLRVRAAADDGAPRIDLILSDRAGEAFASVRDKPATSAQLIEVVRADRIAILLDGKRVADPETRGNATQGVRRLLRALIDGGSVTNKSDVQIVLTKKDLMAKVADPANLRQRVDDFFQLMTRDFGTKVERLTFFEIAARDPSGGTVSGLDALMKDWLALERTEVRRARVAGPRVSEFDRLLDRVGLEYLP